MALEGNNSEGSLKSAVTIPEELPIKLDGRNYLSWREQVESVLACHNLKQFVENVRIPNRYANERDRARDIATQEYQLWLVQDQMLVTWLKLSLSRAIFPSAFQFRHSWQVWDTVHQLMRSALVGHVRSELKNTKKRETQSISEYVATIKGFVDSLVEMGESVSEKEHIEAILEGLPAEYDAMARVIRTRDYPLVLAESFLLQNEAKIQKLEVLDYGRNRNE